DDYGLSRSLASLLVALIIVVQAALAVPGGMLVARSPLKGLTVVAWVAGGAMALVPLASSFWVLLALRVAIGLSFVLMMPALAPIQMRWFSSRELPLMNSLNATVFTVGIGIASFVTAPLADAFSWRFTLTLFGVTMLGGAALWAAFGRVPTAVQAQAS